MDMQIHRVKDDVKRRLQPMVRGLTRRGSLSVGALDEIEKAARNYIHEESDGDLVLISMEKGRLAQAGLLRLNVERTEKGLRG